VNNFYNYKPNNEDNLIKQLIENYYHINEDDNIEGHNDAVENTSDDDESFLDKVIAGKDVSVGSIVRSNVPSIYAFITAHVPNMIKVGYTDQGVETRIKQWKHHYHDADLIGCWTATEFNIAKERVYFKDYPVHKRIERA